MKTLWKKLQDRRVKRNHESGFTLIEMIVSLGIIGMIGTLIVTSVVAADTNSKTADVISFMDGLTSSAKENFQNYPSDILKVRTGGSEYTAHAPYNELTPITIQPGEIEFQGDYTENLRIVTSHTTPAAYRLKISLTSSVESNTPGFSFTNQTWHMKATVQQLKNGSFVEEPIYTKEYDFNNIETAVMDNLPDFDEVYTITLNLDGGALADPTGYTCSDTTCTTRVYKGRSITLPTNVQKSGNLFLGWGKEASNRDILTTSTILVNNDIELYAKYLKQDTEKEYRLTFQIDADSRFTSVNAIGTTYYVEHTFPAAITPKVKDIGAQATEMFKNTAVRKKGFKFTGWEDANGVTYTTDSPLPDQHIILYPKFEEMNVGYVQEIKLRFSLDVSDVIVGNNQYDNSKRALAIYPFTQLEYEIEYNKSDDSFTIIQKEIQNDEKLAARGQGPAKGTIMSETRYNTKTSEKFKLTDEYGKNTFSTLNEFINSEIRGDATFTISDVRLNVRAKQFSVGDYYESNVVDHLYKDNHFYAPMLVKQMFSYATTKESFVFKLADKKETPIHDETSLNELNDRIYELSDGYGEFENRGSVTYSSSGKASYDYRTTSTPVPGKDIEVTTADYANYTVHFRFPTSKLISYSEFAFKAEVFPDTSSNTIKIRYYLYNSRAGSIISSALNPANGIVYDTGIPLVGKFTNKSNGKTTGYDGVPNNIAWIYVGTDWSAKVTYLGVENSLVLKTDAEGNATQKGSTGIYQLENIYQSMDPNHQGGMFAYLTSDIIMSSNYSPRFDSQSIKNNSGGFGPYLHPGYENERTETIPGKDQIIETTYATFSDVNGYTYLPSWVTCRKSN